MSENWVCSQSKPSEYVFGEMPTAFACSQNWIREVPLHVLWGSWRLVLSRLTLKTYLFQWTHHPTELWNWWLDFTLCQLYNTQKHTRTHKDTHTHTRTWRTVISHFGQLDWKHIGFCLCVRRLSLFPSKSITPFMWINQYLINILHRLGKSFKMKSFRLRLRSILHPLIFFCHCCSLAHHLPRLILFATVATLASWPSGWQCPFVSSSTAWVRITRRFGPVMLGTQRMNPEDLGDPLLLL